MRYTIVCLDEENFAYISSFMLLLFKMSDLHFSEVLLNIVLEYSATHWSNQSTA